MERTNINQIRDLFGENFIDVAELSPFLNKLGVQIEEDLIPSISFEQDLSEDIGRNYLLILGLPGVSIRILRDTFGVDPEKNEPCFYNQDWYLKESFIDDELSYQWFLIRKNVFEDTRALTPEYILKNCKISFPKAILCAYLFFAFYYARGEYLWKHDFVWCSDTDHNGDRVYVGKYEDVDSINYNGFSIHRHLALRPCYASIDVK